MIKHKLGKLSTIIKNSLALPSIVLLYHRVANLTEDSRELAVSLSHFEAHLKYLKNNFHLYDYDSFEHDFKNRSIQRKAALITFDDGYADNFVNAVPLLEKYQIPAIFFVSGDKIRKEETWVHQLEYIFLVSKKIPKRINIHLGTTIFSFALNSEVDRKIVYRQLHSFFKKSTTSQVASYLEDIWQWSGLRKKTRPLFQGLNKDELQYLTNNPLFTLGGHTVSHTSLKGKTLHQQKSDIQDNISYLEDSTNKSIRTFAYPFGTKNDFDKVTQKIVHESFTTAFTAIPGKLSNYLDPYFIPRYSIKDWDDVTFTKRISNYVRYGTML